MVHFLYRYGGFFFFAYMAGGLVFLLLIDSTFNGGFFFSVKHLWLPLALLIFGYVWVNRGFFRAEMRSSIKPWFIAALLYPTALLMSWPYLMAVNAATGHGETLTYQGPIERKWIQHGRNNFNSCMIDIKDTTSAEVVPLVVSPQSYASLLPGEMVSVSFRRGGLGIPYRWRSEGPRPDVTAVSR